MRRFRCFLVYLSEQIPSETCANQHCRVGWGGSYVKGCWWKSVLSPLRRREPGRSSDVPDLWGRSKSLCQESFCSFWAVLKGVGVDGAGGNLPFFFAFLRFFSLFVRPLFLRFFAFFFPLFVRESPLFGAFLRFSLRFIIRQGADNCNLLEKWGVSLRPSLHRPR